MRNSIYMLFVVAVLFLSVSCGKEPEPRPLPPAVEAQSQLRVSIDGESMSRVVDGTLAGESLVNDLQVLVFASDGTLCDYKRAGAVISTSLLTTVGPKVIWCLVNAPSAERVRSLAQLDAMITRLEDNRMGGFVMTGCVEADLQENASVSVLVSRMVAKVLIEGVSMNFASAGVADIPMKVTSIYMVNVPAEVPLCGPLAVGSWVNKLGHVDMELDRLLYDEVNQVITSDMPYRRRHVFYPYPNPHSEDLTSSLWEPRRSLLCVEVEMDGTKGYYPIMMPVIERNRIYSVKELVITRHPSPEPYIPVEGIMTSVTVQINDWESPLSVGTIII